MSINTNRSSVRNTWMLQVYKDCLGVDDNPDNINIPLGENLQKALYKCQEIYPYEDYYISIRNSSDHNNIGHDNNDDEDYVCDFVVVRRSDNYHVAEIEFWPENYDELMDEFYNMCEDDDNPDSDDFWNNDSQDDSDDDC